MLPPKPINDDKLANFLAKSCFWAGVRPQLLFNVQLIEILLLMSGILNVNDAIHVLMQLVHLMLNVFHNRFQSRPLTFLTKPYVKTVFLST